jgi:hypothetical protein
VNSGLCKGFCDNSWLIELYPITEVNQGMKKACIMESASWFTIPAKLWLVAHTCKKASENSLSNLCSIKYIFIYHSCDAPFLDFLLEEDEEVPIVDFLA